MVNQDTKVLISRDDYTIGWVCALSIERTAAMAMLDDTHSDLPKTENDPNTYTLGSIGPHNIVIACLPIGRYGNNSAATVAAWMVASFPKVRAGLLVGIGGGIPPTVQLGDIVVSTPGNSYPGVVQWDMGKTESGGLLKHTGSLNNPPMELSTAVSKLESLHQMKGSRIREFLDHVELKYPRLKPFCTRPSSFPSAPSDCSFADIPIHYGLIASDNNVIKDAGLRDRINEHFGGHVLCVEMEAAGLKDNFPCLVIRGICDLADSNKADEWKKYAATAAAAHGKEIILALQVQDVERMNSVKHILRGLQRKIETIEETTQNVFSRQLDEQDQKILDWLSPLEPGMTQSDYLSKVIPGTGQWLLSDVKFCQWKNNNGETLFCQGMQGAGKSFITSIAIDHLESLVKDGDVGIAYIYCSYQTQHEQTARGFLATLLKQLSRRLSSLPKIVKTLYDTLCLTGLLPSLDQISDALQQTVKSYSRVYILIDALDEYQEDQRPGDGWQRFLRELFELQDRTGVNIFATSRPITVIAEKFNGKETLEIRARTEDIMAYIDQNMSRLPGSIQRKSKLQDDVRSWILNSVDGMFLIADLLFNSLIDKMTPQTVYKSLENFPKGESAYNVAYERVMSRIEAQLPGFQHLAKQTISFIAYAKRRLSPRELQHALAARAGTETFDENELPDLDDMIRTCVGLVTIDEHRNVIRLVHHTAQEYFDKNRRRWFPSAESEMARACITALSFGVPTHADDWLHYRLESEKYNSFYCYSVRFWGDHALYYAKRSLIDLPPVRPWIPYTKRNSPEFSRLHLAGYFGIVSLIQRSNVKTNLNLQDTDGRTILSYACQRGHKAFVRTLLHTYRVEVTTKDVSDRTPILYASQNGHNDIVDEILQLIGHCKSYCQGLLNVAVRWDDGILVEKLLEIEELDPNAKDDYGETLFELAWSMGNMKMAGRLFLSGKADIHARPGSVKAVCLKAIRVGHSNIAKYFCDIPEPNQGDEHLFDEEERIRDVGFLSAFLKDEINPNTPYYGETALGIAAGVGNKVIVCALINRGADPNTLPCGQTPLGIAAINGHGDAINELLKGGADPNMKDKDGFRPICWATTRLHYKMKQELTDDAYKLLLEAGEPFEKDEVQGYNERLLSASWLGQEDVVRELLKAGKADINARNPGGQTPLALAALKGRETVVRLLLDTGRADLHARDKRGWVPSIYGYKSQNEGIREMFKKHNGL
ncbi:ankyrin repeat protein [Fusarium austroafricanum]|uniref:Ankyrin repeat protein n=1 Tax=Fusarium austroafricanum TaxID=2364996 RepID=A0A8H4KAA7_9HYPO|nr:ankyrin repeat protein [Fusarium austroafricanum]